MKSSLHRKILAFVSALILLSLLGSTLSLYRITEVNKSLDAINRVSIPLGRLFTQMQSDADIFHRELERRLGYAHWNDPHWRARPIPNWIEEVLENEIQKTKEFISKDLPWSNSESRDHWYTWQSGLSQDFTTLRNEANQLYSALDKKDEALATQIYPRWVASLEGWKRRLQWGTSEYERTLRQTFSHAEARVSELRIGLEIILAVVVSFSLFLLWLGEMALRPLGQLTQLAREITQRGLRKEDKTRFPGVVLTRQDEVSQLAREFHHMATALLEREKIVETQKDRLQEQNRLLKEMEELNKLAAIGKMSAQVAHEIRNPLHSIGLEAEMALETATKIKEPALKQSLKSILLSVDRLEKITENYLKFSRLSMGEKREVDLGEVLESVLAAYGSVCETQKIRVHWARSENANLKVWGDPDLLEHALSNLFQNAFQALEGVNEPTITWSLGSMETGRVWVRIEDNGPGVAPEIREKLFTPFMTTRAQGTGLGLSFVKRVVEENGGEIEYKKIEKGACFEMIFRNYDFETPMIQETTPEVSLGGAL